MATIWCISSLMALSPYERIEDALKEIAFREAALVTNMVVYNDTGSKDQHLELGIDGTPKQIECFVKELVLRIPSSRLGLVVDVSSNKEFEEMNVIINDPKFPTGAIGDIVLIELE